MAPKRRKSLRRDIPPLGQFRFLELLGQVRELIIIVKGNNDILYTEIKKSWQKFGNFTN